MGDIEIRRIERDDREAFFGLMREFLEYAGNAPVARDELEQLLEKAVEAEVNLVFLGAFDESKLVGIVSLTFAESSFRVSPFVWCDDLYVVESHRARGVGGALLDRVATIGERRGCSNVMVGVSRNESDTREFYANRGFVDLQCDLWSRPL